MKGLLKAIVAGALTWVAINLVAMGYQPAKAGSVIATWKSRYLSSWRSSPVWFFVGPSRLEATGASP